LALAAQDKDTAKLVRALTLAMANYRERPNSVDVLSTLGWVYIKRGDYDQAKLVFDKIYEGTGRRVDLDTATGRAFVLDHDQKKWDAKVLLEAILKSGQPFSLRPQAERLLKTLQDVKPPETARPASAP
jgi:uncharacterized protein HemY